MATKEQLIAAIKDGSFFNGFEVGRTARLKQERIEQVADAVTAKILFVGPPKPIIVSDKTSYDAYGYGRGSGHYHGD